MTYTSLTEIIDDIMLLVRNNNISESEDLSRAQIEAWVNHYRRRIWRDKKEEVRTLLKQASMSIDLLMSYVDDEFFKIKETRLQLTTDESLPQDTKRSTTKLEGIMENDWHSILAVHDEEGENIQYMNHVRRHYQYYRKYTFGEMTAYYNGDGYVYVLGLTDLGKLLYIYVLAIYEMDDDSEEGADTGDDADEEDIKIPTWMVPDIKNAIMKNELAFMLNRPSDDDNNATLASVKPHGPQDLEK